MSSFSPSASPALQAVGHGVRPYRFLEFVDTVFFVYRTYITVLLPVQLLVGAASVAAGVVALVCFDVPVTASTLGLFSMATGSAGAAPALVTGVFLFLLAPVSALIGAAAARSYMSAAPFGMKEARREMAKWYLPCLALVVPCAGGVAAVWTMAGTYAGLWSLFITVIGNPVPSVLAELGAVILLIAALIELPVLVVRWSLAPAALASEGTGIRQSFRRSWEITRESYFKILFTNLYILLLGELVFGVCAIIIATIILNAGFTIPDWVFLLIQVADSLLSSAFIVPLLGIAAGLLYFDLRSRREGLDLILRCDR